MNLLKTAKVIKNHNTNRLLQQMRKDVEYIIEPKPKYLPFKVWVFILHKLLKIEKQILIKICHNKSTKPLIR